MSAAVAAPHDSPGNPRLALLGLAALLFVAILIFILCVLFGVRGPDLGIVGLGMLTAVVGTVPVLLDVGRRPLDRHLLLSLLLLVHVAFYVAPVFTEYLWVEPGEDLQYQALTTMAPGDIMMGQVAALVGILSILLLYASPITGAFARLLPRPTRDWPPRTAYRVAWVMLPVGWAFFMAQLLRVIPRTIGTGVIAPISDATLYVISLLAIIHLRFQHRRAFTVMCVLVPLTMIFNFFTGSKARFLWPLLMVLLGYLVVERRLRWRWMVAGLVLIVVFFPAANFYRLVFQEGFKRNPIEVLMNPAPVLRGVAEFASRSTFGEWLEIGYGATTKRLNSLGQLCVVVRDVPDRVPFQGGWTIANIGLSLIPRALWPGKPGMTIGQWVSENFTHGGGVETSTSVGPTWIGELYLNFGFPGIVVGMGLFGVMLRVAHEVAFRRQLCTPALLAGVLLMFVWLPRVNGSLIPLVNGPIFNLPYLIGIHVLVRTFGSNAPALEGRQPETAAARGGA